MHGLSRHPKSDDREYDDDEIPHGWLNNSLCAKTGIQHGCTPFLRVLPLLPYEILCRIFLESRGLDAGAPTTISHVCRRWRQISLDYCGLWTKIELRRKETRLERASAWAERAGELSISLVIRYEEHTDIGGIVVWLMDMAHRIKSVSIMHLSQNGENSLLSSLPPLDHMETFQIVGVQEIDLDMRWIAQILRGSPCLSSLSLSGVGGLHFHESLAGAAGHITHLSIGANSFIDYAFPLWMDAVLDVVSACSGLISLECHALGREDDRDPQRVSLPSLSSLTIGDGLETCLILKYLHTPKLRTLRLVRGSHLDETENIVDMPYMDFDRSGYEGLFVDCIRCLHEISSPPVTKIVWDHPNININVLQQCSPYLRGMEELRCHQIGDIPLSILGLEMEAAFRPFPCLRSVVLLDCTIKTGWLDTIQTLIKQRGVIHASPIELLIVGDCPGASTVYLTT
jgi:F-box-like